MDHVIRLYVSINQDYSSKTAALRCLDSQGSFVLWVKRPESTMWQQEQHPTRCRTDSAHLQCVVDYFHCESILKMQNALQFPSFVPVERWKRDVNTKWQTERGEGWSERKREREICHPPAGECSSCSLSAMLKSFSHSARRLVWIVLSNGHHLGFWVM